MISTEILEKELVSMNCLIQMMTSHLELGFQLGQPLSAAGWNLVGLWLLERGDPAETHHPCTL